MTTEPMLLYLGKVDSFCTDDNVDSSPSIPYFGYGLWRSPVLESTIRLDLEKFVLHSNDKPNSGTINRAILKAFDQFKLQERVKILHLIDVFERKDLDIWPMPSGLPWCDMGYKTKDAIREDPDAIRRVRKFAHLLKNGEVITFPDCIAHLRTHTSEVGQTETRAVWYYPATVTFIEAIFAIPLLERFKNLPEDLKPIAYGFETATGGIQKLRDRFKKPDIYYTQIYFKNFDQTVPAWLISSSFYILMSNINFCEYESYGIPDASKMHSLYMLIQKYFIETTIRTTEGLRFQKFSGLARGSYFTQLIGSVVNFILIN
nr:uncharacterized protein LOC111503242 [Leptinotarsa decemlineata]XP_023013263.1 uncharacterized protein LOC111503242 [Leptinotarsa decemlineata]